MAYLYKHTAMQITFPVNLTCLIPTENPEVGRPERLDLKSILWHFLHFRLEVVTARLEHELEALKKRIHLLEGFEKVFDVLDEVLRIVRKSDGKADAAEKIMKRFDLDAEQTDAILELKIYRLARLEILVIQQELDEKRKRARQIGGLLKNEESRWTLVREELEAIQKTYADREARQAPHADRSGRNGRVHRRRLHHRGRQHRHRVAGRMGEAAERSEGPVDDASARRRLGAGRPCRQHAGDRGVLHQFRHARTRPASSTCRHRRDMASPCRACSSSRMARRSWRRASLDPRVATGIKAKKEGDAPPRHAVAVTSDGYSLRFSLEPFVEVSTRAGRRFARVGQGAEVVGVSVVTGGEVLITATRQARALLCKADEVNFLAGPGRGVILIKLGKDDDRVLGFVASAGDRDLLTVETSRGAEQTISTAKYSLTSRGGRGRELLQRGEFTRVLPTLPELPVLQSN